MAPRRNYTEPKSVLDAEKAAATEVIPLEMMNHPDIIPPQMEPPVPQYSPSVQALTEQVTPDEFEAATRRVNSDVATRDRARRKLAVVYKAEPKVALMVAPFYAAYFGKVMTVSLNGIPVYIPCDGRPHDVPMSYAMTVQQRLNKINEQLARQTRFGDISRNLESSPGATQML